jgi:hypothetical protein
MRIPKLLNRKKSRRYPILLDEFGETLRKRCFELFEQGYRPSQVADVLDANLSTVQTYYRQWKKQGPGFEKFYNFVEPLFRKGSSERDNTLAAIARLLQVSREELERVLERPHGLRCFLSGKLRFPLNDEANRKTYMAIQLAMLLSEHLVERQGKFADFCRAMRRLLAEERATRGAKEQNIAEDNNLMHIIHRMLAADMKKESESSIKPGKFKTEEIEHLLNWKVGRHSAGLDAIYWKKIVEKMSGGLTRAQAREAMVQELIDKGNPDAAATLRRLQKRIDPSHD